MNIVCSRSHRGMTLLELIVAMAISSVVLLALTQMFSESQSVMIRVDDGNNRMSSVRSAFSIVSEDLGDLFHQGARSSHRVPLYVEPASAGASAELSFLVVKEQLDTSSPGGGGQLFDGVCTVGYRVVTRAGNGMLPGDLVRSFADASQTGQELLDRAERGRGSADETWNEFLANSSAASDNDEVVASNVVLFEAEPFRFQREIAGEPPARLPVGTISLPATLASLTPGERTWPQPDSAAVIDEEDDWQLSSPSLLSDPELPSRGPLDPDFSPPDFLRLKLVVAARAYYGGLDERQQRKLAEDVYRDLAGDARLDGKAGGVDLEHRNQLSNLTLMTTSFTFPHNL